MRCAHTAQKMKFSIKDFSSKCDQIADLVTFTEKILNGKLHFLCSANVRFAERLICVLSFHSRIHLWIFSVFIFFLVYASFRCQGEFINCTRKLALV